jgi:DNA-binding beta-propeller fold protein YncE
MRGRNESSALTRALQLACVAAACLAVPCASHSDPAQSGYRVLRTLELGGEGYWDYLVVEPARRRLFVSRSTHVMVVDADSGAVVGDIPGTDGVHAIALAPELGRGFTSNGKAATSTIFDLATLRAIGTVKTGEDPDAILYEPTTGRVFTFNGRSFDATAIDAASGKVVGTVPLAGRPEFALDDGAGRIFVAIKDKGEVVALDARTLAISARWPTAPCAEPSGLAYDASHRRIFAACRSRTLVVLDADSGRVIADLPIGRGVDGAAFDAERGLAFASNDDGTLSVVRATDPQSYALLDAVPTAFGARTLTLDPASHLLYLATAKFEPVPELKPGVPPPRPKPIEGSFRILVVGDERVTPRR